MAYSDIQEKLGQQMMANSVLLAEKYSQGNLFPKGSEGNPYSKNPRAQSAKRKRDFKKAEEEKKKLPSDADIQTKGNMQGQAPPEEVFGEDYEGGPTYLRQLLQIGGAIGGGILPLLQQLLIRNPNAMASTPQDGPTPTRLFYNAPYDNPRMFIKDKQTIDDAKERFKWNTGINLAGAPYSLNPQRIMLPNGRMEYAPLNLRSNDQKERQHMMIYGGNWNKPIS